MKKKKIEQHGDDESSDDDSSDDDLEDSEEDDNNENVLNEAGMTSSTTSITSSIELATPTAADENLSKNDLYVDRYNLVRTGKRMATPPSSPEVTKKPQLAKRVRRFADFPDSDSDSEITFKKN